MGTRLMVASIESVSALPKWLLKEIQDERWIILLKSCRRELPVSEMVGDAEALAYLVTLSMRVAFPSSLAKIFEYLFREVLERQKPDMPRASLDRVELTGAERWELERLKAEIYEERGDILTPSL